MSKDIGIAQKEEWALDRPVEDSPNVFKLFR